MNDYSALIKTNIESLFGYLAPRTSEEQMRRIIDGYEFAAKAHQKQKRRSGEPYIIHPIAVATILAKELEMTDNTVIAAFLHDVVEDTDHTIEEIASMGFGGAVVQALTLLTHDDGVDYMAYVRAIKENPIAKAVKLADLRHNSDLSRLDVVDEKALERHKKYQEALALLEE